MPAILLAIVTSRLGQIAFAMLIAGGFIWIRQETLCKQEAAALEAKREYALQVERVRQQAAAAEIAAEATDRLVEEQAASAEMQKRIDDLKRSEANAKDCLVDDAFLKRLHDIESASRKAAPARRAK